MVGDAVSGGGFGTENHCFLQVKASVSWPSYPVMTLSQLQDETLRGRMMYFSLA